MNKNKLFIVFVIVIFMLASCAPPLPPNAPPINPNQPQATNDPSLVPATSEQPTADTSSPSSDAPHHSDVDLTRLELGNGKASTSPQGGGQGGPPQEAINACVGFSQGATCSVGPTTGTCQTPPNTTQLACLPAGGPPP